MLQINIENSNSNSKSTKKAIIMIQIKIKKSCLKIFGCIGFVLLLWINSTSAQVIKKGSHFIIIGTSRYQYSMGRSGLVENKREGDGGTPVGIFSIRKIYYRPDRINPRELKTNIPLIPLTRQDGWCDDIHS